MKPVTLKSFIPGIAWFFVILILICLPGNEIPEPTGWLEWMKLIRIDKLVHTGIFALLSFLFIRPIAKSPLSQKEKWNYIIKISIATSIWGLCTELIQKYFIPTRSFDMVDWVADSIGAILSLVFCRIVFATYLKKSAI